MTSATEILKDQEGRCPNSSSSPFLNAKNSDQIGTWKKNLNIFNKFSFGNLYVSESVFCVFHTKLYCFQR